MSTIETQVAQMKDQLLAALCQKADAEAQVRKFDETIVSLRNALTGIQVVQQAAEADAKAAAAAAPSTP